MTYEEIVLKVRDAVEFADAREIFEHVAIQINVVGEGSGIFYVEVANRQAVVEPYDYFDRDGQITTDANTIFEVINGNMTIKEAEDAGLIRIEGIREKVDLLKKIKIKRKKTAKKSTAKKTTAKKTTSKKTCKKTSK